MERGDDHSYERRRQSPLSRCSSYPFVSDAVTDLLLNRKTFIIEREDNPLLCLLDHLLHMALYDDVFAAESLRNVSNIFLAKMILVAIVIGLSIVIWSLAVFVLLVRQDEQTGRVCREGALGKSCHVHTLRICRSTWLFTA